MTDKWAALRDHHARVADRPILSLFEADPGRAAGFSVAADGMLFDWSKTNICAEGRALLVMLAEASDMEGRRAAMFGGEKINDTEGRAVLHVALRAGDDAVIRSEGQDVMPGVRAVKAKMAAFAQDVREGRFTGQGGPITDVVNIGIGGSDLGPAMVVKALDDLRHPGKRLHFVSNVDGMELGSLLRQLRPANTLFLIASKTFTTLETMTNAHAAREWFLAQGGSQDGLVRHFYALTTNLEAAAQFGIETTLGFWDWVGGRYSLWSAIGLPIAIAIGAQGFRDLLAGAHAMDEHFRTTPLEANLPVRLALLDLWYRNFHGFASRSMAPYSHGLRRLPAYLQQLEMESNGKGVDAQGDPLPYATAPVVWGEPGTNGQHAFFQMIHQGPDTVPVEFIALREPGRDLKGQHPRLVANALAQARALMMGRPHEQDGHRRFAGNRPSTFLLLECLDPASLGALIALYEHRVFASGALWGINSFDQWGVELGKTIARDLEPRLATGDVQGLDASTAGLLRRLAPMA